MTLPPKDQMVIDLTITSSEIDLTLNVIVKDKTIIRLISDEIKDHIAEKG